MKYIDLALKAWREGEPLRARRRRYKDYTYGRQWNDPGAEGESEQESALRSGFRPHTNNLIRQLVKSVVGNFRNSISGPDRTVLTPEPDSEVVSRNALNELDCRMLEEFLISGCAVQRVVAERRLAGDGIWIDNVSPESFFINRFTDPRGLDIELIGMLHSMSLREILMRFAPEGGRRASRIASAYNGMRHDGPLCPLGDSVGRSFFETGDSRCRVIELWTLESRSVFRCHDTSTGRYFLARDEGKDGGLPDRLPAGIVRKRSTTLRWHCRMMTPEGMILDEFDSPYRHSLHPFAVKFYPLIDGEVHSLVEDIIDQQRTVNRLITLIDHIMSVSAKGALLVPSDSLPPGLTLDMLGKLWSRPNSVIPYVPGKGEIRQTIGGGECAGAYQLLNLQMQLFSQISGVSGALQGQIANSNTSAALYEAQFRNSSIAILDLTDSFNAFRAARNRLITTS